MPSRKNKSSLSLYHNNLRQVCCSTLSHYTMNTKTAHVIMMSMLQQRRSASSVTVVLSGTGLWTLDLWTSGLWPGSKLGVLKSGFWVLGRHAFPFGGIMRRKFSCVRSKAVLKTEVNGDCNIFPSIYIEKTHPKLTPDARGDMPPSPASCHTRHSNRQYKVRNKRSERHSFRRYTYSRHDKQHHHLFCQDTGRYHASRLVR